MMDMTSHDRVLNTMPLFHVGGLNVHSLPTLAAGGTIVLHPRFDPARVLAELTAGDVDLVTLLPPMLVAVLALPAFTDADLTSLRAVNTGAAMVPAPLIEAIHAKGVPVTQIYGLTETATLATCLRREHAYERIGSCGKGALTCEVMLVDDEGQQVPTGSPGEIVARGPNVLHEYWRDTDATDAAFLDGGWFRTGDVATADEDGFLYMQDRKKDMIISGGENIYPAELEELLVGVPGLAEAAVIGRPDNTWGEVPVVVAVRQPESSTTDEDVLAVFVDRVARFKRPKEVIWVGSLPRTAMGKVQKHVLRNDLT
jgi:fatty-acyl-CoA synthase